MKYKLCKIDSACFCKKSFQMKHRAFNDFQIIALFEKKHWAFFALAQRIRCTWSRISSNDELKSRYFSDIDDTMNINSIHLRNISEFQRQCETLSWIRCMFSISERAKLSKDDSVWCHDNDINLFENASFLLARNKMRRQSVHKMSSCSLDTFLINEHFLAARSCDRCYRSLTRRWVKRNSIEYNLFVFSS